MCKKMRKIVKNFRKNWGKNYENIAQNNVKNLWKKLKNSSCIWGEIAQKLIYHCFKRKAVNSIIEKFEINDIVISELLSPTALYSTHLLK